MKALILFFLLSPALAYATVQQCHNMAKFSEEEEQKCFVKLAEGENNWRLCFRAPDVPECVGKFAIANRDPSPIIELTTAGPNEISIYGEKDRDGLLHMYALEAADPSALKLIKDNRLHDNALILVMGGIYGQTDLAPLRNICKNFRGNYEYNDFHNEDESVEEEFLRLRNFCEEMASVLRDHKNGTDECTDVLPSRIVATYGDNHEKEDAPASCKESLAEYKTCIGILTSNKKVEVPEFCKEIITDWEKRFGDLLKPKKKKVWVRKKPVVNPDKGPTVITGPPVEGSYKGSSHSYTVEDELLGYKTTSVHNKYKYYDVQFTADFDGPPKQMAPGETVTLTAKVSGSGTVNEGAGGCNAGISFEYRADGIKFEGETNTGLCLEFKGKTIAPSFVVPGFSVGEIKIWAFLWNCAACNVVYTYKAETVEETVDNTVDIRDVDTERLKDWFEIPRK
jgi:hypothetical protein